jgi:hypothetical protein
MKKSFLIIALMLICFGIKAIAGYEDDCYVKAGDKFYVGTDLKMGLMHTKVIFTNGYLL